MPKPFRLYVKVVDRFSRAVGLVTMYLVIAMIGVLLLNVVTRNVLNIPLSWCIEAAQFILAAYYIVGGAYSLQLGDHVRMDLLYERLSETGKAKLDAFTNAFLVFYLVCLLIGSISSAQYAIEYDQRNFSMWNPSMIPIKVIMVLGIALVLAQAISILIKDVAKARGEPLAEAIGA